jgi:hypothetical protein
MLMNRTMVAAFSVMVLMLGMVTGCNNTPQMAPRDVRVTLDETMRERDGKLKSVQVDLIGVSDQEKDRWTNIPVNEYWKDSSLAASANKYTIKFDYKENNQASKMLSKNDPIWSRWAQNGAMWLIAIEDVQGLGGSGMGGVDPRRLVIPLDKHRWEELGEIKIISSRSGLTYTPQPKPVKQ